MSKNLSPSELNVLQENLDLFNGATQEQSQDAPGQSERKARRPLLKRDKTAAAESNTPAPQATEDSGELPPPTRRVKRRASAAQLPSPAVDQAAEPAAEKPAESPATAPGTPVSESTNFSGCGRQILGVRSSSATQAKEWLSAQGITIENYAIDKRDPALRNLSEALLERGLEFRVNGRTLEWFLISSEQQSHDLLSLTDVEVAFSIAWFEEQKAHIRRLKGADYIDACGAIAGRLPLGQQTTAALSDAEPPAPLS